MERLIFRFYGNFREDFWDCYQGQGKNREKKSLRHVNMVAKLLDVNKPCGPANNEIKKRKTDLYDFPRLCMIALKNRDTPYFSSIVRQSYGRLCHTFLLYWPIADRRVPSNDPTNNYITDSHCIPIVPSRELSYWRKPRLPGQYVQACQVMRVCDLNRHQG